METLASCPFLGLKKKKHCPLTWRGQCPGQFPDKEVQASGILMKDVTLGTTDAGMEPAWLLAGSPAWNVTSGYCFCWLLIL